MIYFQAGWSNGQNSVILQLNNKFTLDLKHNQRVTALVQIYKKFFLNPTKVGMRELKLGNLSSHKTL